MLEFFGYISAILSVVMVIPYIRDIIRKETQPERASWLIWTVLGFIAFFSQLSKGATDSLWLTGGQTFAVLIVFILSIKFGTGWLSKHDKLALLAAGFGLLLWWITTNSLYALFIVIGVDSIGTALTLIKSYKDPKSETLSTWIISGTSGVFGALAVGSLNLPLLAYPVYIILANYAIVTVLIAGKKK